MDLYEIKGSEVLEWKRYDGPIPDLIKGRVAVDIKTCFMGDVLSQTLNIRTYTYAEPGTPDEIIVGALDAKGREIALRTIKAMGYDTTNPPDEAEPGYRP